MKNKTKNDIKLEEELSIILNNLLLVTKVLNSRLVKSKNDNLKINFIEFYEYIF